MDSVNSAETENEVVQPTESVPAEVVENTPAQGVDTEEREFYVDVEGDSEQPNGGMDERQLRAAWKEEKRKRKDKADENTSLKEELASLRQEVSETKEFVAEKARGPRPDPYDFDSTDEFYKADEVWRSGGKPGAKPVEQKPQPQQANSVALTEDQEWHLHQSEKTLQGSLKDYEEVKGRVSATMGNALGVQGNIVLDAMAGIAHVYEIDPAKAFYALDKIPDREKMVAEIVKHKDSPAQIAKIMRDLSGRVKTRERKAIDTKPEPEVSSGGPVDMLQRGIEKARQTWADDPTTGNYKAYQAAKAKLKQSK